MIDIFLENLRSEGKSELTIKQYRSNLKCFFGYLPVDPAAVTQLDVANYKRKRIAEHLKPSTINQALSHLRNFYDYLESQKLVLDNPAAQIAGVPVQRLAPKWLDRNEQNRLIRAVCGDLREQAIITTLLHTGLRIQELVSIKMEHLKLSERSGSVEVWGKFECLRTVPLNVDSRQAIEAYLQTRKSDSPFLFNSQRSPQITTRGIQFIMEKYRRLTGIEHLTAHALRHTCFHELSLRKVPPQVIATIAGHMKGDGSPNIAMTVRYTLPDEHDLQRAVEELSWT